MRDALWRKLVPPKERMERKLWQEATLRVYRSAKRRGNKGLMLFAALWAYGCDLVKLT